MSYWVLGLVILGMLLVVYPIAALMPRGRQKAIMRLRNRAAQRGLRVAFPTQRQPGGQRVYTRYRDGDRTVEYQRPLPDTVPGARWRFRPAPTDPGRWRLDWEQGGADPDTLAQALMDWAADWRPEADGAVALEQRGLLLVACWDELGGTESVDKLDAGLRRAEEALLASAGGAGANDETDASKE